MAPMTPPLTGASSISTPFSASLAAISRVAMGLMVLMSMKMSPFLAPCMAPLVPRRTSSTSGLSVTMVTTTSEFSATSLGLFAALAPASTNGFILVSVLFQTVTGYPAFTRFFDMPVPMRPRPMNPMRFIHQK